MTNYQVKLDQGVVPSKDTKIVLAKTIKVPPICNGCWQYGDTTYWGWTEESKNNCKKAFDTAYELGLGFYDTAEVYGEDGESEREIGEFRKSYTEEEQKQQIIATKYFPYEERTEFPKVLLSALKDSLDRLGVNKVDLYQIHAPIHPASIEVVADALADAFDAGLVKTVGVSNYGLGEIERMHAALKKRGIQLASNQVSFSLVRTHPKTSGLVKLCHDLGVAILAYSPLGMGILTGKYKNPDQWPKERKRIFGSFEPNQLKQLLTHIESLSIKYNRQPSAIALNWIINKGAIPIAGAKNEKQMRQNAEALGFALTDDEIATLDKYAFEGTTDKDWKHG
ncbi:unnamed protein product [Cunninghamella blakesleeana]